MKTIPRVLTLSLSAALLAVAAGCTQTTPLETSSPSAGSEPVAAVPLAEVVTETVTVDPADPLGTELSGLYSVEAGGRMLYHYVPENVGLPPARRGHRRALVGLGQSVYRGYRLEGCL